jgi:hypothetical protein
VYQLDPNILFIRVYRVVHSCKTIAQYHIAVKYAKLYLENLSESHRRIFQPKVKELLSVKLARIHKDRR